MKPGSKKLTNYCCKTPAVNKPVEIKSCFQIFVKFTKIVPCETLICQSWQKKSTSKNKIKKLIHLFY